MFSKNIWTSIQPLYQKITAHPFIQELISGKLSQARFIHYMQQDAIYLVDFSRALALIAGRSREPVLITTYINFAKEALVAERMLHEHYFEHYHVTAHTSKNQACSAYTDFLLSRATIGHLEEAMAAVLPCFWIYAEVGKYVYERSGADNPYQKWIGTYASTEFENEVKQAIDVTDKAYAGTSDKIRATMHEAFIKSSELEYWFWDHAYALHEDKF